MTILATFDPSLQPPTSSSEQLLPLYTHAKIQAGVIGGSIYSVVRLADVITD